MSIFPQASNVEIDNISTVEVLPLYKEVAWDFINNSPILVNNEPMIVEGNEAIKVWIYKALLTERFKYQIYSWDYGSEIETLINKGFTNSLIISEVERFITEALLINEYILAVDSVEVGFNDDTLKVDISVSTIYGEVEASV
ncbi:MAG: DUF2634 domain-containing protein [Serratia marcescens]|nr:DUF2634 domain-containing protein [Serratia marcescens]